MYGMVNRAIEDLVVATAGEDAWGEILSAVELEPGGFNDSESYDDALTYQLVAAASEVTGQSPESILHAFGRHWILYTGREGWGAIFDAAGDNFIDFIRQLDSMHSRVQLAMPDLRMPSFTVLGTDTDGQYIVEYRSEREGLSPMVTGLLTGLAEKFNESWAIEQTGYRSESGYDSFTLVNTAEGSVSEESADAA